MGRLANKVAMITGAASGIGFETARLFLEEGAQVILTDIQHELGAERARALGRLAEYQELDVTQEHHWQAFQQWMQTRYPRGLDILVNNAGIIGMGSMGLQDPEHATLDSWQKIHAVNLEGVFLGCKYGIAMMKNVQHIPRAIVNVASRSGMVGVPDAAAYASSKAAIRNHTKTVALYCAREKYNIRCNAVCPGAILTPLWDPMWSSFGEHKEAAIANLGSEIPIGHMGRPIDVAYGILYLASEEAAYVTGTELVLDGGILAGTPATPNASVER